MNAAVVNILGQPPRFQEFPEPIPGEGEVVVNVRAAGLHPVVKSIASGTHYSSSGKVPMVPGVDGVGTLGDGRRVYFGAWGSMAERVVVPASMSVPLPEGIDDLQAAAVANPGMSAWLSIKDRAALAAGETVMILGATGVAGHLAIQIARHLGAKRVIGVGRNVDALKNAPVDAVIGLNQPEEAILETFTAEASGGIDAVIDYLWGRPAELLLEAVAKGFRRNATRPVRWVEVGASAGNTIGLRGDALRSVDLTLRGSGFGSVPLDKILNAMPGLFAMAAAGELKVTVDSVPIEDVETAWTRVEKGKRMVFTI
jgi:NADPH:quinone reductase-like Zn-dependent oxidoreductase